MKIVIGTSTNPYLNLAMEEYFLKEKQEDFFMLWRNEKAVIIGKNQNAYAEINHKFVSENDIKVVRRMTGGGAVFHDLGNVNYTFIKRNSKNSFNDYAQFSKPIIKYLVTLGVDAHLSGRNDMLIGDKKFSGNAQCAYKDSVMHHGTLLFSSEKSDITDALNVNPLKVKSKGITSVRSRVTNISEHLDLNMNVESFINGLCDFVVDCFDDTEIYELTACDLKHINELVATKYSTAEWNYGFKQEYSIINEKKYAYGLVQINMSVNNNIIDKIKIYGDFFGVNDIRELEDILTGTVYLKENVVSVLDDVSVDLYIKGMDIKDFLEVMF